MIRKLTQFKFKVSTRMQFILMLYIVIVVFMLGMWTQQFIIKKYPTAVSKNQKSQTIDLEKIQETVVPQKGYVFKVRWGNLGKRMVEDGVIDKTKLAQAVSGKDSLPAELEKYVSDFEVSQIELNANNSHFWVDMLWGLGLANKNEILDKGPMMENGDASNFASTGGYTLGVKQPMKIYSKYSYINLSEQRQAQVKEIAENIYRPCCGNSTAFPDCNHGMAALALIELMVSQNFSKEEIYKTVLAFNSYWFPQTYLNVAYHFAKNDRDFKKVSAREILSKTFSSSAGNQALQKQLGPVEWPILKNSGSCGA